MDWDVDFVGFFMRKKEPVFVGFSVKFNFLIDNFVEELNIH